MSSVLTPTVAVVLMYSGVVPSLYIGYMLYGDREKPGVLWFVGLMVAAALWAALFGTFTLVRSPGITLALANVFWATVPAVAVLAFLLAYEYVHGTVASRRTVVALFAPVAVLFVLSWSNPFGLVFTDAYAVDADGFLYVPPLGGPVKILVTKVYGYLLVSFAAGMLLGEVLRTTGVRRRQTLSLFLVLVALAASTLVKILELVPEYFDPTAAAFSLSGLVFAYSIERHGLLTHTSIAREQAFQEIEELILVVDDDDAVIGHNRRAEAVFGADVTGRALDAVLSPPDAETIDDGTASVTRTGPRGTTYYSWHESRVEYGRGMRGRLIVLSDITTLKQRQEDLALLKTVLTRVFRHNMRNDFNVIVGYAGEIEASAEADIAEKAAIIARRTRSLQDRAEKARELEVLFGDHRPVRLSLREVVARAIEPYRDAPDVSITVDVDDVVTPVHPQLSVAIEELVGNAHSHGADSERTAVVISSAIDDGWVVLAVEDDGPGIPEEEIAVLDADTETPLRHSSGIGLWLVKMIVTRFDGRLEIDTGPRGTRVEIHVPTDAGVTD